MKPSQIADALRRIASRIEKSNNPDRRLVAQDLNKVLAAISGKRVGAIETNGWAWLATSQMDVPTMDGSQLLWFAMRDLGMDNWNDDNPAIVYDKIKEIAAANNIPNCAKAIAYAQKNWRNYLKFEKNIPESQLGESQ